MKCEHDLAERESACADGMCPLCLAARLAEESRRHMEQTAELVQLAEQRRVRLAGTEAQRDKMREALLLLLPGLGLDLRYADMDDDKEAMEARIQTVTEALSAADSADVASCCPRCGKSCPVCNDPYMHTDQPNERVK